MENLPKTKAEAKALGLKYYFTGNPCKNGHLAKRQVLNGACRQCSDAGSAERTRRTGKGKDYAAKHRLKRRSEDEVGWLAEEARKARERRLRNPKPKKIKRVHRLSFGEVLRRFLVVHGDTYSYDQDYTGMHNQMTISCLEHGDFRQTPSNHIHGSGCPRCAPGKSRGEEEVAEFVKSVTGREPARRTRRIIAPLELDVYDPESGVAIEYCGSYWHSTQVVKMDKARVQHRDKFLACEKEGVRLITIYDHEWRDRRAQVEAIISRALGVDQPSLHARKLKVVRGIEARDFFATNHIQGPARHGVVYGLKDGDDLVAAMAFAKGASQRGKDAWELVRFASSVRVVGGASRLFAAFVRDESPSSVVSFSDNRFFVGGVYPALGFVLDGEIKPDYGVVHPGAAKVSHKALFQRRNIPARLKEIGSKDVFCPETDPRSEREVVHQNGFGWIFDCGKKRWIWTPC